jgi:hypothetical protein
MHTPGPWRIVNAGSAVFAHDGVMTASVYPADLWKKDEMLANARLIAAAPELLEELKDLVAFFDPNGPLAENVKSARAAIAKATGEQ